MTAVVDLVHDTPNPLNDAIKTLHQKGEVIKERLNLSKIVGRPIDMNRIPVVGHSKQPTFQVVDAFRQTDQIAVIVDGCGC